MRMVSSLTRRHAISVILCGVMLGIGCGPSSPTTGPVSAVNPVGAAPNPKTIRIGVPASAEQTNGLGLMAIRPNIFGAEHSLAFHAGLTAHDADLNLTPRIALRVPTVENGDIQLRPDGSMEVAWRLRPDVVWHDGTPLTAEDFVFGYTLRLDRELPIGVPFPASLVSEVSAPDAHTFVVRWKQPYFLGGESTYADLVATPRHILQALYEQGDRQAFSNSLYWTREFVGLGPYRMGAWESGSTLEGIAFDRYFLGKPRIDRVIFQYIGTPDAQIVSLLGGGTDVAPIGASLATSAVITIKNAWSRDGQGTVTSAPAGVQFLNLQQRPEIAPWAGDVTIRRALVHGMDRQTNVEELNSGLTPVADTFVTVEDPVYRLLAQRGLARYPYDPGRARQLLAEAGWTPGPDGVLQKNGQRFEFITRATTNTGQPEWAQAIASQLNGIGIAATMVPSALSGGAPDANPKNPGVNISQLNFGPSVFQYFTSATIPTEENKWVGLNIGGYSNPRLDQLYQRYQVNLVSAERNELAADAFKIVAEEVASIPLYYRALPVMYRSGVRGLERAPTKEKEQASTWNIHLWEMD
jgi:peptide/nickel transport system substrate-binding protein